MCHMYIIVTTKLACEQALARPTAAGRAEKELAEREVTEWLFTDYN